MAFAAIAGGDGTLIVGTAEDVVTWAGMNIGTYVLPGLDPVSSYDISLGSRIAPADDNGFFQWERGSTTVSYVRFADGNAEQYDLGGDWTLILDVDYAAE